MEDNQFTILWWFLHTSTWISHGYTCVPPSWTQLPPHPIRLGCPRAPALGTLLHASNLHCSSILHMVIQMFQCYSLIYSFLINKIYLMLISLDCHSLPLTSANTPICSRVNTFPWRHFFWFYSTKWGKGCKKLFI